MKRTRTIAWVLAVLVIGLGSLPGGPSNAASDAKSPIEWQSWSSEVFARAKAEKRFVLLDLEAVWCHWCHVMDQKTYADPGVAELLKKHYIAVKVDQDSRPDLTSRYEQYGWPATIIFGPDGTEIVKRRGFIEADILRSILEAVVEDPSPVPGIEVVLPSDYADHHVLETSARNELDARHRQYLDTKKGGLEGPYRYLPWEGVEYALALAADGDQEQASWVETTLVASLALIDPAWGGVYQYSVQQSWDNPHFEKIMQIQAENLRAYALAGSARKSERDAKAAADIARYVRDFLTSPEGSFYTSQDADHIPGVEGAAYFALDRKQREAKGIPRVDKNRYARENGWMIEGLASSAEFLGRSEDLAAAEKAARWVLKNRAISGGGFRHGEAKTEKGGPFLGDTLAMGRGFLALYRASGDRSWLAHARSAAGFIEKKFRRDTAGYISAPRDGTPIEPIPQFDDNIRIARFANLLHHYTGDAKHRAMAEHAFRYVATPDVYGQRREVGGMLLADRELGGDPLHLTIVGPKSDDSARALYAAALRLPGWYKRVEWLDAKEGPLPNADVEYPKLDRVAAFVCNDRTCSRPLFAAEDISRFVERSKTREAAATTP